jgi:protein O-GlcNAc transferase
MTTPARDVDRRAASAQHVDAAREAFMAGQVKTAIGHYQHAIVLWPNDAGAQVGLGAAWRVAGRNDLALAAFQTALGLDSKSVEALTNLAILHDESGKLDAALDCYQRAIALQPTVALRLLEASVLPPVFASCDEIDRWRNRLSERLAALAAQGVQHDLTYWPGTVLFYLAYQGRNDRELMERFGRLHRAPPESTVPPPRRSDAQRLRVGFVSGNLREHTIGHLFRRMIARLASEFDVVVGSIGHGEDDVTRYLRAHVAKYINLPLEVSRARALLTAEQLDVLVYTDLGIEPWSLALAHSRLAAVQCSTWGHPVTSGLPTIDYFLSTVDLDAADAQSQYTERLVRLAHLPSEYERPQLTGAARTRADWSLPTNAHLYGCLQTIFKFHPDFDPLLRAILERDDRGILTLAGGRNQVWLEQLLARFRRTLGPFAERVRVLPAVPRADYLHLLAAHDVLLDPIHFGGGNTSYEGLSFGVPIVTWPSGLLRGRITTALYRTIKMNDCIAQSAEEYVALAVRLGVDPAYRAAVSRRINERAGVLFDNPAGAADWGAFFRSVTAQPV